MTNQENKDNAKYLKRSISLGKARLEELLDAVESERHNIKFYQGELDKINRMLLEEEIRAEVISK